MSCCNTKYICKKCGKTITTAESNFVELPGVTYRVCDECRKNIEHFITTNGSYRITCRKCGLITTIHT